MPYSNWFMGLSFAASLAAGAYATSAAADNAQIAGFCDPLMDQTASALMNDGVPGLNTLFETADFRDHGRDQLSWTISVGAVERDVFVDNVLFPELRDAPGYMMITDATGDAFMVPLAIAFDENSEERAFTSATWSGQDGALTVWTGYASRISVSDDTYEIVCWVDDNSLSS